jgi:hypothetical protein
MPKIPEAPEENCPFPNSGHGRVDANGAYVRSTRGNVQGGVSKKSTAKDLEN